MKKQEPLETPEQEQHETEPCPECGSPHKLKKQIRNLQDLQSAADNYFKKSRAKKDDGAKK